MLGDFVKASGIALIEIFREDGSEEQFTAKNLITTSGRNWLAQRQTENVALMSHMACGSNGTAPAHTNTALWSQTGIVGLTRSRNNNTVTYVATFGAGVGTGSFAELGIFNAASGGTMLNRVTFSPRQKGSKDTIKVTWNVTQS